MQTPRARPLSQRVFVPGRRVRYKTRLGRRQKVARRHRAVIELSVTAVTELSVT